MIQQIMLRYTSKNDILNILFCDESEDENISSDDDDDIIDFLKNLKLMFCKLYLYIEVVR